MRSVTIKKFRLYIVACIILFLVSANKPYCQISLNGTISDSETGRSIADATIKITDSHSTISNKLGKFSLLVDDFPAFLEVSHVSYQPRQVVVRSNIESDFVIHLSPKINQIDEVVVAGEKLKRFFETEYFYVIDYAFIEDRVVLIGFNKSQFWSGEVRLMTNDGRLLESKPITRPKKLLQDAFGNYHLFAGDSVYQLYVNQVESHLLYPTHKEEFSKDLLMLQFADDQKFLFKEIKDRGLYNEYFVLDTIAKERKRVAKIYDLKLYDTNMNPAIYSRLTKDIADKMRATEENIDVVRGVFEDYAYDALIVHRPITSQAFKWQHTYLIFDMVNRQILHYDNSFNQTRVVKSKLPKHKKRRKVVVQDPFTEKLYWVYYHGSRVMIGEINPLTGKVLEPIETPPLPFIENIKINNGTIWFTYQPRLGEQVRSLYRLN